MGYSKGDKEGNWKKAEIDIRRGVYRDMMGTDGLWRYQFGDVSTFEKQLD